MKAFSKKALAKTSWIILVQELNKSLFKKGFSENFVDHTCAGVKQKPFKKGFNENFVDHTCAGVKQKPFQKRL
ncbi:hypothetical protein EQO05_14715 [Methanosarcina sp. MSH10X1]|nr:hypothetical protein EQO05_14715 [Methanosarcina sp. MSH10X1]